MIGRRILFFCGAASALVSLPMAELRATCWKQSAVAAARVRTMETLMMVSALRCRDRDATVLPNYNKFVLASRGALDSINGAIREKFAKEGGMSAYDKYVTQMANQFGNGKAGMDCAAAAELLTKALAANGSLPALSLLAESAAITPHLTEAGACPVRAGLN